LRSTCIFEARSDDDVVTQRQGAPVQHVRRSRTDADDDAQQQHHPQRRGKRHHTQHQHRKQRGRDDASEARDHAFGERHPHQQLPRLLQASIEGVDGWWCSDDRRRNVDNHGR
jgi:hypothetical protein